MKKIISIILLSLMIFMLEFNWFKVALPDFYPWFEAILAFGVLICVIVWNGFIKKK